MTNLVVGVDGSAGSTKAVALAVEIAAGLKCLVVLAHVLPLPAPMSPEVIIPLAWLDDLAAAGKVMLSEAAEQCAKAGVQSESRTLEGPPDQALAKLASQLGSELIAVGSRGRGPVSRLLLGSVADRLVQTAGRPVLVAR